MDHTRSDARSKRTFEGGCLRCKSKFDQLKSSRASSKLPDGLKFSHVIFRGVFRIFQNFRMLYFEVYFEFCKISARTDTLLLFELFRRKAGSPYGSQIFRIFSRRKLV